MRKTTKKNAGSNHMRDHGKVQVSVYLDASLIRQIDAKAKREGRKRANVVTGFVVEGLRQEIEK